MLIQERIKTLADGWELVDFIFVDQITYDPGMLVAKGMTPAGSLAALEASHRLLEGITFDEASLEPALRDLAVELGLKVGQFFAILACRDEWQGGGAAAFRQPDRARPCAGAGAVCAGGGAVAGMVETGN